MDFPEKIATVIFTQGCNLKCPYCHNTELLEKKEGHIPQETIFKYIKKNRLLLDGVVISGGEPCLQQGIISFSKIIKGYGLTIKLDTNGTKPEVLEKLINLQLLDYIAMDIKSAINIKAYSVASGCTVSKAMLNKIKESVQLIINSGIDHEFRTTLTRELISMKDILSICSETINCNRYYLQTYLKPEKQHEQPDKYTTYSTKELQSLIEGLPPKLSVFIR